MDLELVRDTYSVCRLPPDPAVAVVPAGELHSVTYTTSETSIVCPAGHEPSGAAVETGWRVLRVLGPLDLAMTGVLAALTAPLAAAEVTVFTISTYETDYLLIKEVELARAVVALEAQGHHLAAL